MSRNNWFGYNLERQKMKISRQKLLVVIFSMAIFSFIGLSYAIAQNFEDLESANDQTTEVSSNVQEALPDELQPKLDAGQTPEDDLKQAMKPKEYEQFMSAKKYSDKNSTYTLGPKDIIEVIVLRHPEVSGKYILNNEGKIQYEFIGDVVLSGLTKEQASELLAKTLSTYIVNPQVTIKISEYNSKIVYIIGEVGRPGKIVMRGDTITVREALLEAGLPLLTANTTHSTMFTPIAGNVKRRIVDVNALLYKGDLRQNFIMKPGDTLYVPATFWAKATRVISPITQPIGQAASTGATVTTGL